MKKVNIYQLKDGRTREYGFMTYKWALAHGFNLDDYELVAEMYNDDEREDERILDRVWLFGNDGTYQKSFKMRSVSVSDIIEIDGTKYYVDSFGFKEI